MTTKETAGREGKGEDGRARTREVKLAVFFTQDKLDESGYPVRDRKSESDAATFEPAAMFGNLVKAEGIRRGAHHVRQLTILGDGAAWIWNIATAKFPEATQIVDLYHAREHLHDLARPGVHAARPQGRMARRPPGGPRLRRHRRHRGSRPQVPPVEGVKKDEVERELGYFLSNAPRMRYHWFRSRGLFVGSGVVEASCKTVIGQRLKQSGMHWTVTGADSIIALRCKEASRPEDQFWQRARQPDDDRLTSRSQVRATPPAGYRAVTYKIGAHPPADRPGLGRRRRGRDGVPGRPR